MRYSRPWRSRWRPSDPELTMDHSVFTISQRPGLEDQARQMGAQIWPEFMLHDPIADRYWERLFTEFPDFQIVVCDAENRVIATGNTVPFSWSGTTEELPHGWDAVLEQGVFERERGVRPTDLSALLAIVATEYRGQGLSRTVLNAMRTIAAEHGLRSLLAPVRPTAKSRYPHVSMENYVQWTREDGELFDPWLRVHTSLGARLLGIAPHSMVISGEISDWREWTGMDFPRSGEYVVPGALQPVEIDLEKDLGIYEEPNVWMRHTLSSTGEL